MAWTRSIRKFKLLINDTLSIKPFFLHPELARKTVVNPSQRPTPSQKTPAYLYTQVGGARYGGKTYIPKSEKHKRNKSTAPPMKSSAPVQRGDSLFPTKVLWTPASVSAVPAARSWDTAGCFGWDFHKLHGMNYFTIKSFLHILFVYRGHFESRQMPSRHYA